MRMVVIGSHVINPEKVSVLEVWLGGDIRIFADGKEHMLFESRVTDVALALGFDITPTTLKALQEKQDMLAARAKKAREELNTPAKLAKVEDQPSA